MKVKTSELSRQALNWVVATLEYPEWVAEGYMERDDALDFDDGTVFDPAADPGQGAPILFRERIDLRYRPAPWHDVEATFRAGTPMDMFGPDALVAGLRCFVASRLGDEVEVPEYWVRLSAG